MRGSYDWVCHQGGDTAYFKIILIDLFLQSNAFGRR